MLGAFALAVSVSAMGLSVVTAEGIAVPSVSRVEVVLADQYRSQAATLGQEFALAGLTNVHFQFARLGQPPQNIGLGRNVPAEQAREAVAVADGVVMGASVVRRMLEGGADAVGEYVAEVRHALDHA